MKKQITLLTTVVLCVVSLVAGIAAGLVIANEIRDEFGPGSAIRSGTLKEPDGIGQAGMPPAAGAPEQPAQTEEPAKNASGTIDISSFIGEDKAKELVLNRAGLSADDVIFDRVELDNDGGVWHYEVEFRKDFVEYDADVAANDGTILSWEVDNDL